MQLPEGHQSVMPYLIIEEAEKFGDFAEAVFQAEITHRRMREDGETIMHAELQITGSTIMFADSTKQWSPQTGNLFIYVADADESFQKALDQGAKVIMGLSDQDYGRTCGVEDPFGNTWWITSVIND